MNVVRLRCQVVAYFEAHQDEAAAAMLHELVGQTRKVLEEDIAIAPDGEVDVVRMREDH